MREGEKVVQLLFPPSVDIIHRQTEREMFSIRVDQLNRSGTAAAATTTTDDGEEEKKII